VEALGDPGNIIQDTTTGIVYASQGQAARALGVFPARISENLTGKLPNVNGHCFTKIGKAAVPE
jgi:plasmid maintenance system antidote protein VapI